MMLFKGKTFNETITTLFNKIDSLEKVVMSMREREKKYATYDAIGYRCMAEGSARISLLIEARHKGFFDDGNYFNPVSGGWRKESYFKHHFSGDPEAYDYYNDMLRIPAIGIKGNCSLCSVIIYQSGVWAEVKSDRK